MREYPTKKDIEKHSNQLIGNIRQYILGLDNKNADFVRNALNCLFSDLILELNNTKNIYPKEMSFKNFLNKLARKK